jgi:hypothetical protein
MLVLVLGAPVRLYAVCSRGSVIYNISLFLLKIAKKFWGTRNKKTPKKMPQLESPELLDR